MPKVLTKSATLTLRVDPAVKDLLSRAAEADRRSQANMVEVMVLTYCEQRGLIDRTGLGLPALPDKIASTGASETDTGAITDARGHDKNQIKGTP